MLPLPTSVRSAEDDHVVDGRIERLARFGHDERAVQPRRQLTSRAVRVIDERAGARRGESHHEGAAGLDHLTPPIGAAPAVHAIVVALELDAVPVNAVASVRRLTTVISTGSPRRSTIGGLARIVTGLAARLRSGVTRRRSRSDQARAASRASAFAATVVASVQRPAPLRPST